jgi:hypothetical protein
MSLEKTILLFPLLFLLDLGLLVLGLFLTVFLYLLLMMMKMNG